MKKRGRGAWLWPLCATLLAFGASAPAQAAPDDPLFVFVPKLAAPPLPPAPPQPPAPPPNGYFNGPCGLAVDSTGRFYVSDYYHDAVDVFVPPPSPFTTPPFYVTQRASVSQLDGPCALALDAADNLYVNVYHRNVAKFSAAPSFVPGSVFDSEHPTGVAVDPASANVYVNDRTYIAVYESSGASLEEGGEPLRIGLGTLEDGNGLAISEYPATEGFVYVPDASDDTVKVYDPTSDIVNPVESIDHPEGFVSLRDSAVAVDRVNGDVYVVDNTQPAYTEESEAVVYVFDSTGAYKGHLKYNIVHGGPVGLAVDNSAKASQGRVYVTSGNTHEAGLYAYPPGAATKGVTKPPSVPLSVRLSGTGQGKVSGDGAGIECASACSEQIRAGGEISLTASPDEGSAFVGWSGGACERTAICTVQMSAATSVSAEFAMLPFTLPATPGTAGSTSAVMARGVQRARRAQRARQRRRAARRRHSHQVRQGEHRPQKTAKA